MSALRIGIMVGEPSGDLLAASLMNAILAQAPDSVFEGIAGPRMIAAGCRALYPASTLSVMGFIDPLLRLPQILRLRRGIIAHFLKNPPDVVIGIDSPDFMLGVEKRLKSAGIRTIHYVSPSLWAWRAGRIRTVKAAVDHMLVTLPFEQQVYQAAQIPVTFVGHPLADEIPMHLPEGTQEAARRALGLPVEGPVVALLAGSRSAECKAMVRPVLEAAARIAQQRPEVAFIVPTVQAITIDYWKTALVASGLSLSLDFCSGGARQALMACDVALVKSGTATLESMLCKRPMTIIYKTSAINYWIAKQVIRVPFIGLPNLLAGRALVPELIQDAATPQAMADAILHQLAQPHALDAAFMDLHRQLACDASAHAAAVVLALGRKQDVR